MVYFILLTGAITALVYALYNLKYSLIILSALVIAYLGYKMYRARTLKKLPAAIIITPENTIFAFDLHRVVLHYDYKKIASLIWHNKQIFKGIIYLFNPFFVADVFKFLYRKAIIEECIMYLSEKYPGLKQYVPVSIELSNAQHVQHDTVAIIKELKAKGYSVHLFSNIGPEILKDLQPRLPWVFDLFDEIHIPLKENSYLAKPYPAAFENYLEKRNKNNKQVVFVDDKQSNIIAARNHGIAGLLFTNATEFERELKAKSVL